jgi:hypothetical protein
MTRGAVDSATRPPVPPLWRSSYVLGVGVIALLSLFLGSYACDGTRPGLGQPGSPLCQSAEAWRAKYPSAEDLVVIGTRVSFRGTPGIFTPGDGLVVAPVALQLPGAQEVLEVAAEPPPLRKLNAEGVIALTWEYAGSLTRDLSFDALALVRRPARQAVADLDAPTFDTLAQDIRVDAMLSGALLEEAHVRTCKAFPDWARTVGGAPPYTAQLLRILRHVGSHLYVPETEAEKRMAEDACAALRAQRFTEHQAQVLAVMAGRELHAPTLGLHAGDPKHSRLVATWVDGKGWIQADVSAAEGGFFSGGPALVAKAPMVGRFEAALETGWIPAGAAFQGGDFGTQALSSTEAAPEAPDKDTTSTWSRPLRDVCR